MCCLRSNGNILTPKIKYALVKRPKQKKTLVITKEYDVKLY